MFKTVRKVLLIIVCLAIFVVAAVGIAITISPKPFVYFLRSQKEEEIPEPEGFSEILANVASITDIAYPSQYKNNLMDIYYPENQEIKGTFLWTHGGSFIGGDKAMLQYWGPILANEGYVFISMNYQVAPESHYPGPLVQMQEAYEYLLANTDLYPMLTLDKMIIGGDSAGAQIASQFVAIQTNDDLAASMNFKQVIAPDNIIAAVLFCGPYDLKELASVSNKTYAYFIKQIGWAYLGMKNWQNSQEAKDASTVDHITSSYPTTFLTDGNSYSFETHARELEDNLKASGVQVTSLFFDPEVDGAVNHEYQFHLETEQAKLCLEMVKEFLSNLQG